MRLTWADIVDTVEAGIGYVHRVRTGGDDARLKDAELQTPPGYYARANDADEDTVGTEDALVLENGSQREIIGTNNSKGTASLIGDLGRELDKGETILTAEDGTARCYVDMRPNGEVVINADDGGGNTMVATWDSATGNLDLEPSGEVRVGGAAAIEYATIADQIRSEINANVTIFAAHTHNETGGVTLGPNTVLNAITLAIRSSILRHH